MSNIGFALDNSNTNLTFIYLILVIIGGSFFSTSSGIRFLKIYALFKFAINDLMSHVRPKNIFLNTDFFLKINFQKVEIDKYFL